MMESSTVPGQIGPYRVVAKLGDERFGPVYLIRAHPPTDRESGLARVVLVTGEALGSTAAARSLLTRVERATHLGHPNLARSYGAYVTDEGIYVASEYVDGQPWSRARARLWSDGQLRLSLHLAVLSEMLAGLQDAHERDQVHGALHPARVTFGYDGSVKIADFGLGGAIAALRDARSRVYLAPEQWRGEPYERSADVYAAGVMLWEALARTPLAFHPDEPAPDIAEVVPDCPPALAAVCTRALAADADARFGSAGALRDALLRCIASPAHGSDRAEAALLLGQAFADERALVQTLIDAERARPTYAESAGGLDARSAGRRFWPSPAGDLAVALAGAEPAVAREPARVTWLRSLAALALAFSLFGLAWYRSRTHTEAAPGTATLRGSANAAERAADVPAQPAPKGVATVAGAATAQPTGRADGPQAPRSVAQGAASPRATRTEPPDQPADESATAAPTDRAAASPSSPNGQSMRGGSELRAESAVRAGAQNVRGIAAEAESDPEQTAGAEQTGSASGNRGIQEEGAETEEFAQSDSPAPSQVTDEANTSTATASTGAPSPRSAAATTGARTDTKSAAVAASAVEATPHGRAAASALQKSSPPPADRAAPTAEDEVAADALATAGESDSAGGEDAVDRAETSGTTTRTAETTPGERAAAETPGQRASADTAPATGKGAGVTTGTAASSAPGTPAPVGATPTSGDGSAAPNGAAAPAKGAATTASPPPAAAAAVSAPGAAATASAPAAAAVRAPGASGAETRAPTATTETSATPRGPAASGERRAATLARNAPAASTPGSAANANEPPRTTPNEKAAVPAPAAATERGPTAVAPSLATGVRPATAAPYTRNATQAPPRSPAAAEPSRSRTTAPSRLPSTPNPYRSVERSAAKSEPDGARKIDAPSPPRSAKQRTIYEEDPYR